MRKTALELAIEECSKLKDNFNSPTPRLQPFVYGQKFCT